MVDRNLQNFHGRLGRIDDIHRAGGGFEADGTLGMSFYNSRKRQGRRRLDILATLVLFAVTIVGFKAVLHATIGAHLYEERIADLRADGRVGEAGAYVMQADPITLSLSEKIGLLLK